MTEFNFIRHGESALNLEQDLINGRSNTIPLTARGLYQASLVGAYLRENNIQFDDIFSSGAVRADSTAQAIIEAAGYDSSFVVDERLLEVSQGPWSGMERDQVYDSEVIARYKLNELDGSLPGAESIQEAQIRIRDFVHEKTLEYPYGRLLVVTHGLLTRSYVADIEGLTKQQLLALQTPNASSTVIVSNDTDRQVLSVGKSLISE